MPQLNFFMKLEDEISFAKFIFNKWKAEFIADMVYLTPVSYKVKTLNKYVEVRKDVQDFFIYFSKHDNGGPIFEKRDAGPAVGTYFIWSRKGGPFIDLSLSGGKDNYVTPGILSCYPSFENKQTGRYEKTPKGIMDIYKEMSKYIRKTFYRSSLGSFYIGPEAARWHVVDGGELRSVYIPPEEPERITLSDKDVAKIRKANNR